jgi:hypothetical protein
MEEARLASTKLDFFFTYDFYSFSGSLPFFCHRHVGCVGETVCLEVSSTPSLIEV